MQEAHFMHEHIPLVSSMIVIPTRRTFSCWKLCCMLLRVPAVTLTRTTTNTATPILNVLCRQPSRPREAACSFSLCCAAPGRSRQCRKQEGKHRAEWGTGVLSLGGNSEEYVIPLGFPLRQNRYSSLSQDGSPATRWVLRILVLRIR